MTLKICCIGTSHLGCLKSGWETLAPSHPEVAMTFFGAPNSGLTELISDVALSDGQIIPRTQMLAQYFQFTSGGHTNIHVKDYDAFAIIGCGVGLTPLFDIYQTHRSDGMTTEEAIFVSQNCLLDTARGVFLGSTASKYSKAIKSLTNAPIFIIPDPRPSIAVLDQDGSPNRIWDHYIRLIKKLHLNNDGRLVCDLFRQSLSALAHVGAKVIDASGSMVSEHIFTPDELCRGSVWLQNGAYEQSPSIDFFHMNGQFGGKMLTAVIKQLPNGAFQVENTV